MGLDMFLYAKKFASEDEEKATKIKEILDLPTDNKIGMMFIEAEVMYWRKANQIHKWFVENVQEGQDDCEEYYVSRSDIEKLILACNTAWTNKDASILPPESGFFFGTTDIDEWYWDEIQRTAKELQAVIDDPKLARCSLYYHSSW